MPSLAKRRLHVGVLSSIASRPLSPATSAATVSISCCVCMSAIHSFFRGRGRDRTIDDGLCFLQDLIQMIRPVETFRIDLVDVFGPGRPRREPAVLRAHLDAADRRAVAGSLVEN